MVYESLGGLYARGAVLTTGDEKSTLYLPLLPDVLLDRYDQEQRHLINDLRDGLRALHTAADEEYHVWSVTGRSSAPSYANQMIRRAKQEGA